MNPLSFVIDPTAHNMQSPYACVPYDMLYCHICKKQMCDAVSFENHLNDPVHLMRFPYIEERYRQTALMMRHELKIAEHLKSMELNLARRKIKERQSYCTICDLKVEGSIAIHRKAEFHLHMSTFLLPQKLNQDLELEMGAERVAKGVNNVKEEAEIEKEGINNVEEEAEIKEESLSNDEADAEETNVPQRGEEAVVTYILPPNSEEGAGGTKYAVELNEPQEDDEKMFLIVSTSNSNEVVDETNNGEELTETQAADTDVVVTVSTPDSMQSPYVADEPNDKFYCNLCKKNVWDSFENHITNPTHVKVRECLEASYVQMEKHIRLQEEIAIAMGRNKPGQSYYCDMCDTNFHGRIADHRNTECHLQLKKFFHPTCAECNLEFDTRIDYDTHLLTAEHMIKIAKKNGRDIEYFLQFTLEIINGDEVMNNFDSPTNKRKREDEEDDDDDETNNSKKLSPSGEEEDEVTYDSDESILYIGEDDDIGADVQICSPECDETRLASPA